MLVCISILDVEEAMELTKSAFFCSAYTKNINQSTTGTALQIVASITKNDSEN